MASEPSTQLYVDGSWCSSSGNSEIISRNPAKPDERIATFPAATVADTETAISASAATEDEWAAVSAHERGSYLRDAARVIEGERESLSQLIADETGKTIGGSRGEIQRTIDLLEYYAQIARDYGGTAPPSATEGTVLFTKREPWGTAGIITPWNFPIAIPTWKIAPALVSGNTVVFKPASLSPTIASRLVDVFDQIGLPDGVINFVPGSGSTVGDTIATSQDVDVISFTGSTAVGEAVERAASDTGARVQCEMGGKNAIIVDESCDLDLALDLTMSGAYGLAGQACTAASRAIVLDGVYDEYVDALKRRVENLVVGDPSDESTDMGPKASANGLQEDLDYIEAGESAGATLLTGGAELEREGHFIEPTVFVDVEPGMEIAQEEIFGPVLSVLSVSDFDEAVRVANDVQYGLTAAVCTDRLHHAMSFIDDIETGVVKINQKPGGVEYQMPFGGRKRSSTETFKEQGREALEFFTHEKAIYLTDGHL
ncbi:aldehyde dehydrogenase family protein [Halorubrum aethiopicum]|uniref:aldehyde dehydrogenase family protein n=1 Tax=Halorubrum aethiopicum TaxID=1758255 RepID=UPI000833DCFA|nr:aldehyde dehydrogenase family protein [Halorubrum aethiopicum]